ncbi:ShlB/FhaC/HecB family hemolysin secretion/activation protein [Phormidesmis priestleyi ULC007]|uniref:ShlB/FhaC/HecB family hemolysin secretion/activation protein n=1 Tax=Phormidesmis priestleyi ULC007 TaxID=1920490 RepID=A0A2T1D814_9CYAN|nr:ShlB/FhaC/HecB family hemolysin secretion/activation protein [Phormidesmis priestleyi]PSB16633.1 ShlB/FhaC/HecB family hemolysin secretion/activation protein [Phormidesmis priestleyi ULC007]PZO47535.1 MAG: ShlB/FhaC/HecB family hemolysin secretion/activation protein [Phormidesmis priestleyi]
MKTIVFTLALFFNGAAIATAQSPPPAGVTIPPNAPQRLEQTIPTPSESPSPLPPPTSTPPPRLTIPATPSPPEPSVSQGEQFFIKKVEVSGNTVLQREITALVKQYEGKKATFEDILNLRAKITQLYTDAGYITSGAFLLNNQALDQGIVRIKVVEGELEQIEISGLTRLRDRYVRSRLERATKPPLNRRPLEEALQLLQLDPLIAQVNAELTAGTAPGRNRLRVSLREAPPFHAGVAIANDQSPSIGEVSGSVFASHDNLLGFGDRLTANYSRTEALDLYNFSYTVPFNSLNGTASISYGNNASEIIEEPFQDLGIRSKTRTLSFSVRQPVQRSPRSEFALGVGLDLRRSQTFILDDIPFSFSEGPDNGESKVTVIRFFQDWTNRGSTRVLAARSQFSFGINAFDATINDIGTDGRFFSWLGQFQWVQQVSPRVVLISRLAAQLTPDSLLSLERFSLGGVDTVRGYRQNQLVSDNGVVGSLELRIPLTNNPSILQLTPFVEVGSGWNNRGVNPDPQTIASLGVGLRWLISPGFDVRVDYGIPLVSIDQSGNSLQDSGIYFSLRYQPF